MSAEAAPPHTQFPVLRWVALVWLAAWVLSYASWYGAANFLQLCDVAVVLSCVGLFVGSPLLLSTQAVSSLVVNVVWVLDVLARLLLGRHLIGGTEYMWDARFPLWLRLMSLFHLAFPPLLVYALRRVGYDRRALAVQAAGAAVVLLASRLTNPAENINYAFRDMFFGRQWGPAPVHVLVMWTLLVAVLYWPTHAALRRWMPPAPSWERQPGSVTAPSR